VVGACVIINYVCLKLFVEYCGIRAELANILTTIIATVFSYFSQKHFSFKK
jgi:putative flippase GtrA